MIGRADFPMKMSVNIKDDSVQEHVKNAQDRDLKPLLGSQMFSDFVNVIVALNEKIADNPAYEMTDIEESYFWLFNGHNYGTPVTSFDGLKMCIAYYAYARLLRDNDLKVNAGGNSYKVGNDSERPSSRVIDQAAKQAESVAYGYWLDAVEFLNGNADRFAYYKTNSACCKESQPGRINKSAPIFSPVNNC